MRTILLFITPLIIVLMSNLFELYRFIPVLGLMAVLFIPMLKLESFFPQFESTQRIFLWVALQLLILNCIVHVIDMKSQLTIMEISCFLLLVGTLVAWFMASREKNKSSKELQLRFVRNLYFAFNLAVGIMLMDFKY